MNAVKFWILIVLALANMVLVFLEISNDGSVVQLTDALSISQSNMTMAQRQQEMLKQLIQRMANESRNDPAMVELLTKHGVHLNVAPAPGQPGNAGSPAPAPAPAAVPTSTPAHKTP